MAKKIENIIKNAPDDIMDDSGLQNAIINHVQAFGFCQVIDNIIEAYRVQARRYNKQAEKLEKLAERMKLV